MTYRDVMNELKAKGTAQNRKVYARHGIKSKMYGVSYAELGALKRRIKVDHELALKLWDSGNHDARVLATMIADPDRMDAKTLDAWAKELDSYSITDAFVYMTAQTKYAEARMKKWTKSKSEWLGSAGWGLLGHLAGDDGLADSYFDDYLVMIESGIHSGKNRARYAMNNALISIGSRSARLEKKAVAAAKRIGAVEVDHGETGCKTPDAVSYIAKTRAYRAKKAGAKKVSAKKANAKKAGAKNAGAKSARLQS